MSEEWKSYRSTARLETNGDDYRLHLDYAVLLDDIRKDILCRRVFTVLANEEKRLMQMTDAQAIAELDALKASQDKQFVKKLDS
jgi:hypothetical protein